MSQQLYLKKSFEELNKKLDALVKLTEEQNQEIIKLKRMVEPPRRKGRKGALKKRTR